MNPRIRYSKTKITNLTNQQIAVNENAQNAFTIQFLNIFSKYTIAITKQDVIKRWGDITDDETNGYWQQKLDIAWSQRYMQFWQNQVNFAVWIATTGCGIGFNDHLSINHPYLQRKIYKFHVYYTIRRILSEMSCPLPTDPAFDEFENSINMTSYNRICNEFGVSPTENWKNNGSYGDMISHIVRGVMFVDGHRQKNVTYKSFIQDDSNGLTPPGLGRINDSIRTYCWAILGSQGSMKKSITNLETQKYFLSLVEDAINRPFDLPASIERYRNVLKYSSSKVDYVINYGLYMVPSKMELKISTDYNNTILIATPDLKFGKNSTVNLTREPLTTREPDDETPPITQLITTKV